MFKKQLKLFIYITAIISTNCIIAQTKIQEPYKKVQIDRDLLFSNRNLSITFIPYITQKASINNTGGTNTLGSSVQPGLEGGIDYYTNFSKSNSIYFGLHVGVLANNYIFTVKKNDFTPPANYDYDISFPGDLGLSYFSVPVCFEQRNFISNKIFLSFNAGINVRWSIANSTLLASQIDNDRIIALNLEQKNKLWLNYNIGADYNWILNNFNILKIGILLNFSATSVGGGDYEITIPGKDPSFGKYNVKGSFVGLKIAYVLTKAKKVVE